MQAFYSTKMIRRTRKDAQEWWWTQKETQNQISCSFLKSSRSLIRKRKKCMMGWSLNKHLGLVQDLLVLTSSRKRINSCLSLKKCLRQYPNEIILDPNSNIMITTIRTLNYFSHLIAQKISRLSSMAKMAALYPKKYSTEKAYLLLKYKSQNSAEEIGMKLATIKYCNSLF